MFEVAGAQSDRRHKQQRQKREERREKREERSEKRHGTEKGRSVREKREERREQREGIRGRPGRLVGPGTDPFLCHAAGRHHADPCIFTVGRGSKFGREASREGGTERSQIYDEGNERNGTHSNLLGG